MKVEIVMPKMGESINEGTIIKWHKKVGDRVKKDEIIYEISTDKVDTEIPSPADGILSEIKAYENETVPINEVVAIIETEEGKSGDVKTIDEKHKDQKTDKQEKKEDQTTDDKTDSVVDIPMPKMGESVMEGTIIKWHKKVGDSIKSDEILYEISTDKVDTEVPSPVGGIIKEILVKENETVEVGKIVAKISTKTGSTKVNASEMKVEVRRETHAETRSEEKVESSKKEGKEKFVSNRFYSPLVMNIASKEGISQLELESIEGTGIGNRVSKKDILDYLENKRSGKTSAVSETSSEKISYSKGTVEKVPMDNIRKRIMEHMIKSRDTSVHVSEVMEVDMTRIHNFIEKNKERFLRDDNIKLTYMAFISYAAIRVLKKYPLVNASIEGDNIVKKKNINLGIAVSVEPNGLIVPNIKNADEKNIRGLAKAISEISYKSRNKGLTPDDIMDGTFSITNYGVFGALFGTPIINQPEVAILGVGAVVKKPVVIEVEGGDTIAIKPMMYLTLSHDHRLVDGMLGGMFLKYIKDTLELFDVESV
ncbi:MAG: 2-oxoglutarate dehydrogenase, E2 component, dihydrolipoamide succinyltransferase [Ignavibacteriae bacterium]|nr:2-oxoglutarate dehydrogenase, E2 component, dihydrolipoamide succinyltransferase [Ignavibacteriota bacterium]